MSAQPNYDRAFNALGDPTRRKIFEKLASGPLSVVHIAEGLTISRPAVSQHLKILREAKLVSMVQEGTRSIYRIDQEGVRGMREYLHQFWDEALANFKKLAEQTEQKNKEL